MIHSKLKVRAMQKYHGSVGMTSIVAGLLLVAVGALAADPAPRDVLVLGGTGKVGARVVVQQIVLDEFGGDLGSDAAVEDAGVAGPSADDAPCSAAHTGRIRRHAFPAQAALYQGVILLIDVGVLIEIK